MAVHRAAPGRAGDRAGGRWAKQTGISTQPSVFKDPVGLRNASGSMSMMAALSILGSCSHERMKQPSAYSIRQVYCTYTLHAGIMPLHGETYTDIA
jgi:hypothetical protein